MNTWSTDRNGTIRRDAGALRLLVWGFGDRWTWEVSTERDVLAKGTALAAWDAKASAADAARKIAAGIMEAVGVAKDTP